MNLYLSGLRDLIINVYVIEGKTYLLFTKEKEKRGVY